MRLKYHLQYGTHFISASLCWLGGTFPEVRMHVTSTSIVTFFSDDDVIKWKHLPRYWPFVRGIHRSPVKSPHKGQWRGSLMFSLICAWINAWVNNREAGDLRRHYNVTVMSHPPRWKATTLCATISGSQSVLWNLFLLRNSAPTRWSFSIVLHEKKLIIHAAIKVKAWVYTIAWIR